MIINNEHDKCGRCGEGIGEIPISTADGTSWLCETCDSDLYNTDTTLIIQEIDKEIRIFKDMSQEGYKEAIKSLEYIKSVVERA